MFITVAICTWNRADLLEQTLACLAEVRVPSDVDWEVLVVNNNCTDHTDEVIAKYTSRLPLTRLLETKQGHSHARNCAVTAARGEIVIWTDDDVQMGADWLAQYVEAARAWPDAAYFGGQVIPWYEAPPAAWVQRHVKRIGYCWAVLQRGPEVRKLALHEHVYGANMAYRIQHLRTHPFDPMTGRVGDTLNSGDDLVIQDLLQEQGQYGVWLGTSSVRHFIPARRMTIEYLWKFHHDAGRGLARRTPSIHEGPRLFGVPRWLLRKYLTARAVETALKPLKNRRWLEAFLDSAKLNGMVVESRAAWSGQ